MKSGIKRSGMTGSGLPVRLSLLALAMISCQLASAAEPGWYIGANLGESRADIDDERIVARLLSDGFRTVALRETEDQTGFKIFTGYQFNRNFAVEGGYFDLGQFSYTARMEPWAIMTGDAKMRGLNVDLVGFLPLGEKLSAFGRAGAIYAETRDRFRGYGPVIIDPFNAHKTEASWKYGAGLQYDFTDKVAMRLEAERYRFDDAIGNDGDIDLFSLGVVYRFGSTSVAPVPVSAPVAAAPRAAAAAPAPAPAPTPPPPAAPVRVTFSADSLFDFDSSVVKPAGRAELDKLAADLRGVEFDTILVTGHTDRIGSQAYNLRLSNERAIAVKDYLVRSANISASQVSTRGVNGAEPVTTAAQCGAQLTRAQLIPCLAPDRRVEVEVTGTRPRQ
ncbi:MAG: outer membrane beta-barrel protein [Pseudohongiella sp.]|nr:outer membrane beta-barrel protein [Pseudohongiella sp.]